MPKKSIPGYVQMLRKSRNLIRSEYFSDALRTTLSIILPFAALYYFSDPQIAITVGVGALLVSLTDSPGTFGDKIIMSVSTLVIFFIISLITALLINQVALSGLLIFVLCILFALFTVFGKRWTLLGTMALILMTFVQGLKPANPISFSCYIVAGGICYYLISLVQTRLWPLSSVKHALGECILSTAEFLGAKAAFYDGGSNLQENYLHIIKLHNKVNEKQEQVRDLLLRNKLLMRDDHAQGQRHLLAITQVIDLYELISAIQYDYESLQRSLASTGLLTAITRVIGHLSNDLQSMGIALCGKIRIRNIDSAIGDIQQVRQIISEMPSDLNNARILRRLQQNIDDIHTGIRQINDTLTLKSAEINFPESLPVYQLFASTDHISYTKLKKHIDLKSPIFRFALRLSMACLVSYSFMMFPVGIYSYWILLTVIVVLKPGFGLTKKRNIQRLKGTLAGVLIGTFLLLTISNLAVQLVLAGIFLLGYFVYLRLNYLLSIMSLTPMVIICLNIYTGNSSIVFERTIDTLIGCAIAFGASYLFPSWEIKRHTVYIGDVIRANLNYLHKLYDQATGKPSDITSFKLARKEVYTRLALLSSGIQNMLLEPKKAQGQIQSLYEFEILSHQLSSTIASFFPFSISTEDAAEMRTKIAEAMQLLTQSLIVLDNPETKSGAISQIAYDQLDIDHPSHVEQHKVQQILIISEAIHHQIGTYTAS
jgi:uncharacterized membrane protein YccC